ncbi:hypothetical protein ACSS6W_007819 [Trichoderma asperelloides]|uniref:Uncharacterized protein n=1 Tax=Trichoderma asperellum TaxID=101201 RepID=A0A6V8R2A5_TRIAP|nr:hypothetical protein TASIC1_0012015000 [Trichoderma asperellum]
MDINMSNPDPPRRRFVPVPIETSFQSYRKNVYDYTSQHRIGPNPELTPEPSPRSPEAQFNLGAAQDNSEPHERRRFAPQLIETSRRSRRVGEQGPATKPADKTDITPYTNHIYSAKSKSNRRQQGHAGGEEEIQRHVQKRPSPPTRRETEEEGVQEYLLELAAKEVARQIEEVALAAFPNSRPREGGVAHFYFREGSSDSENSPEASPPDEDAGQHRLRRKSSNLGLNWWHKHMQEHALRLEQERGGDRMDVDNEEAVVMEEEEEDKDKAAAAPVAAAADSPIIRSDSDLDKMELPSPPDLMWTTTKPLSPTDDRRDSAAEMQLALAEANRHAAQAQTSSAQAVPPAHGQGAPGEPHPPVSQQVPGRQEPSASPFGRPFGAFRLPPDQDPKLLKLRQGPSPPMLGKDLVFRRCPSPKFTTLEPEDPLEAHMIEDQARDLPGQAGLWRGYCCRSESTGGFIVPPELHNPKMIETPITANFPGHDAVDAGVLSEEPVSIFSHSGYASSGLTSSNSGGLWGGATHQHPNGGAEELSGLKERLQREKANAERDDKILQEFDGGFVTQVYNYLSLGYPAMARGFDEELSRISHIGIDQLRRDDAKQMAKGHMVEVRVDESAPEEERCPRWVALRSYITEWARQHPDLDNLDPLAWGVRERRGSWAI